MKKKIYLSFVLIIAAIPLLWAGYVQAQKTAPGRPAWEYKLLVYIIEGQKVTLYEDARPLPAGSTPIVRSNELGSQGWEMVGTTGVNDVYSSGLTHINTYSYWFKRPK